METRSEFLGRLRRDVSEIRRVAQHDFYFLEEEDLRRRPAPDKWSITEVFAHINLVNGYYLKQFSRVLAEAEDVNHDELEVSWLGKRLRKAMEPQEDSIPMKMPTFPSINPRSRAKKGIALDEKVIFRDFVNDMDHWEEMLIKAYDKDINELRIKSLFPLLKLRMPDALEFVLAHTRRHLLQAQKVLGVSEE